MKPVTLKLACALCIASTPIPLAGALPLGTAFTYQGQLKTGGAPVTDHCDFLFSLWTAPQAGSQVGSTSGSSNVTITNGLFQTQVDFGPGTLTSEQLWLEVALRCPTGTGAFTAFEERQPLTATPFALQTRGIVVDANENVGIGTAFPANKVTIRSTDISTLRLIGPIGLFGYGDRLNFGDGEYAYIEEDLDDQINFYAGRFAFSNGRVGVGTLEPGARLDVSASNETGVRAATGAVGVHGLHQGGNGTFPGVWGESDSVSTGASGVRGTATATTGGAFGVHGKSNSPDGEGVYAENTSGGTALKAIGNGSFRDRATLHIENTQSNGGMAAFMVSQGSWATMHLENESVGEVLWLQRPNDEGPFIVAFNESTQRRVFSVSESGYTKVSILEVTGGADFAEGFEVGPTSPSKTNPSEGESTGALPGLVVSIDPESPGRLRVSDQPYDTKVAGILSGAGGVNPGMVMGQAGTTADGTWPVALSGRVYCYCDASSNAIRPGDLLTTSSRPGHAMKVQDHDRAAGAVIGKAMTSLESGTGLVLVLVTLQ